MGIASFVPAGAVITDVGTDHGYLASYLVKCGIAPRAIASDIRPGPLAAAVRTAESAGVSDKIEFILCDGLENSAMMSSDVVIIAGMGGENIAGILERATWIRDEGRLLILQPMSKSEVLRMWLYENRYVIGEERLVSDGTIYQILTAHGGHAERRPTQAELYTGQWDKIKNDPLLEEYLNLQIKKAAHAVKGLETSIRAEDLVRLSSKKTALDGFLDMKRRIENGNGE